MKNNVNNSSIIQRAVYKTPFSTEQKTFHVFRPIIYTTTGFWGPENANL